MRADDILLLATVAAADFIESRQEVRAPASPSRCPSRPGRVLTVIMPNLCPRIHARPLLTHTYFSVTLTAGVVDPRLLLPVPSMCTFSSSCIRRSTCLPSTAPVQQRGEACR